MGLFSRRKRGDNAVNADSSTTGNGISGQHHPAKTTDHTRRPYDATSGYQNTRPSFGQWLKMTWLDILTMVIMGAIGLGVYKAHPAPTRSFPVYFQDGEVVYPQFAYPLRKEIIPIWAAAMLGSLVPIAIILLMQIRIRSFWDVNNAIIGLLYSLINAAVFQVFLKWLIGGLRPHFLAVCIPAIPNNGIETGTGFRQIMYDRSICTGDRNEIDDSLESFPSGHSTAAFAGLVFLYLYLNAKLKVFSNHHPAFWKLILLYAPILGATLIAGALTIDEYHNWYDCLAGAIIGTVMAFSAYRMVYASVWDFRFNHIPLTRHTPFGYGAGDMGFANAVWTRKAGWGQHEGGFRSGAPFDAEYGLHGNGVGEMAMSGVGAAVNGVRHHHRGGSIGAPVADLSHQNHHHHHHQQDSVGNGGLVNGTTNGYHDGVLVGSERRSLDRRPVPPAKTGLRGDHMV